MKSKKTTLLSLAAALLILIGGIASNCACWVWFYQPREPKALRSK